MRGRKPKPERLRVLDEEAVRFIGFKEPIKPPSWLKGEARAEWKRIVGELAKRFWLGKADRPALEAYCQLYARWREATELLSALKGEGVFTVPTQAGVKSHPLFRAWMEMGDKLRMWGAEFGLTPAARSRIDVKRVQGEEEDDLDSFLGTVPIGPQQIG